MWDSVKNLRSRHRTLSAPIIYPIYVNSFTQQTYFMKIGLPELHVEMSPVSSHVCRTLSPRGCYKCYCLDKKSIRLHILHSTNLALQCLGTSCEFVGDLVSSGICTGHTFPLLCEPHFTYFGYEREKYFFKKIIIFLMNMPNLTRDSEKSFNIWFIWLLFQFPLVKGSQSILPFCLVQLSFWSPSHNTNKNVKNKWLGDSKWK